MSVMYHASKNRLACGPLTGRPTRAGQLTAEKSHVEDLFEARRPPHRPTRMGAIYACPTPNDCAAYFAAQHPGTTPFIYEVTSDSWFQAPMVLVDRVRWLASKNLPTSAAIDEYWVPGDRWQWLESLAASCVVLQEVLAPSDQVKAGVSHWQYMEDRSLACVLFPDAPS